MFIRKWSPVLAPKDDIGSGDVDDTDINDSVEGFDDALGEEQTESRKDIRSQLESGFKKASEDAAKADKTEKKPAKGREGRGVALKSRARQELEADPDAEVDPEAEVEAEDPAVEIDPATPAVPKSLPKEAKAEWEKTPKAVQAAYLKREQDMDNGVKQLKQNYAEIDQVLAPRLDTLRQMGHTPGQAVHQLFSWFDALGLDPARVKAGQPPVALLALANSLGIDLGGMFTQQQQQQAETAKDPKAAAAAEDDVPPAIKNYIGQLEAKIEALGGNVQQGFQNFQNTFATQAQEQTNKILSTWSDGKPYFDEVRMHMANIIRSGMVAPKEDGSADLDAAYDMAVYANPEVREKVLADRRAAAIEKKRVAAEKEKKVQQAAADKARRAGAGLGPSAPGITLAGEKKQTSKKSVRESIADAMSELGS